MIIVRPLKLAADFHFILAAARSQGQYQVCPFMPLQSQEVARLSEGEWEDEPLSRRVLKRLSFSIIEGDLSQFKTAVPSNLTRLSVLG
jgi:hypothetical protein